MYTLDAIFVDGPKVARLFIDALRQHGIPGKIGM
jgi:hypothetical protein